MKRHLISKVQGTVVVLPVLIAITLGMIFPSPVLGKKPLTEYVDVVLLECSYNMYGTYDVYATVEFYEVQKEGDDLQIGAAIPSCHSVYGGWVGRDADSMEPIRKKPTKWGISIVIFDPNAGEAGEKVCESTPDTGTRFPATLTYTCDLTPDEKATVIVTIGTPRVFP